MPPRRVSVLLVEDDRLDRMAFERLVLRQGLPYEIVSAVSGADAMQKLRARRYDVVLLDYMLGDMTGLELMPELGDNPAIFLTSPGNEEVAASAIRQGAYGYLVKDDQRAYLSMLPFVVHNVLERRRLEDAMRETQRRMSTLLQSLNGMAFRCTPARQLLSVSHGCVELTGYSVSELVESRTPSFTDLIVAEDRDCVAAQVRRAAESGEMLDCTYRLLSRTGEQKWVRERSLPVLAGASLPSGPAATLEGYLEDITAQVTAEMRARFAQEGSEEALRIKDQFVNQMVHDLRAPLSTCMLTVQQLRQELTEFANSHGIPDGTERRRRFAGMFDGMTDRTAGMLRTMDQLLLGSRLHGGRLVPVVRAIGGAEIKAVVASLEPLARQKGIAVTCDLPPRFRLIADPDLIAEVIQNLLTNAIKFTAPGGMVDIAPLAEGAGFLVRDSGVGIPREAQADLFARERRHSTLGTTGERGAGLGLVVCDEIVSAHGGTLDVISSPGAGSEFRVRLPASQPRLLAVGVGPDEESTLRVAVARLDGELLAVQAEDPALDLALQHIPQAVLLDGTSPSAARTLLALRSDPLLRGVPILWYGPTVPPAGQIPDERLPSPLREDTLREALRVPFGS